MLHKYKAHDMAVMLDLYDREFLDEDGEPLINVQKTNDPAFFERIVALIPLQIPFMTIKDLVRTLEVLVK